MSQNYLYHCVQPENVPNGDVWEEFAMCDFALNFPQRKMVAGSLRLSANVELKGGKEAAVGDSTLTSAIFIDPLVGSHALFDQMSVTLDRVGQIENIMEYSKYAKAVSMATTSPTDTFKGSKVCELVAPNENWSKSMFKGLNAARVVTPATLAPVITDKASFSMKPLICLNSAVGGDGSISFRKSGTVRLSLRVARALATIYGPSVSAAGTGTQPQLKITNLRCHFASVSDDGQDFPLTMSNTINVKSTIQSTFANVSCAVPAVCRSVFGTLIRADREAAGGNQNPLACEVVPEFKSCQFLYNDTINNSMVSYSINNREEVQERFVRAVSDSDHSSLGKWELKHDDGFGIGLRFGGLMDLRQQRFNIQIESAVSSATPYILNLFFAGVQTL